ncbi:MAG: S10 family peptidase [Candidatus Aminicenantaceae bacterium]
MSVRSKAYLAALAVILIVSPAAHAVPDLEVQPESAVTTEHTVMIKGQRVPYQATAGTQPVWDENGKVIASVFYVFYQRTDVKDRTMRPLFFSFNGGPGSSSVWMHLGYTGPRRLKIDEEGFPIPPYGIEENNHSILDVADIVFVDPVNTGFSRIVGDADRSQFFGVNEDIEYLAGWMDAFVTRHNRWRSPKFLIGESYGTTRVAGLAEQLQNAHWMFLNGVVLVSPTSLAVNREGPVADALSLPYFAAAAWYHKALSPDLQNKDLYDFLPQVEEWTIEEYIPALARGGFLDENRRREVAQTVARYSGISEKVILDNNLSLAPFLFWKELLREEGLIIGRLDSRYRGIDREDGEFRFFHDPAMAAWNHAFTPAINHYLREILGYKTDHHYNIFGPVRPWNREGDNTGERLRAAMAQNPYLHVMIQSGYYDGGTDYFSAKYTMWNLDPSGKLKNRLRFESYRSGHMMYLRDEDLPSSNEHIREFIREALSATEKPAGY